MQSVPPYIIYLVGASLVPLFKGKVRNLFVVLIAAVALVSLLFVQPQRSFVYAFSDFEVTLFNVDRISLFMGYIFALMALFITVYSIHINKTGHHIFSFLYIGSAMGVVFAGDFVSFYLFVEMMALTSTVLICCDKDSAAVKAGFKYLLTHLFGGSLLLAGILLNYLNAGSMDMASLQNGVPAMLILAGIGIKAAFIPFHAWLPDAYSKAPFTVSLLLSVFTTKSAVYALARIFPGVETVAYMGAAMAVFGVIFALLQSDARKLLSYHVISQVGFMVAGVGMGTFLGIDGALYHAWNHILYKSLLFMCIGAVIYRTGEQNLSNLGGFAWKMPITTIACIIAALSISGVPFFNGYASKAILYEATYGSDLLYWMLKIASFATFLSFCKFTYFGFLRSKKVDVKEAPLNMLIPMTIIALLCILGGIYPRITIAMLPYYIDTPLYLPAKVLDALIITTASGIVFFLGMKRFFNPHKLKNPPSELKNALLALRSKVFGFIPLFQSSHLSTVASTKISATSDLDAKKQSPAIESSLLLLAITIALLLVYMIFRQLV